jgi:hypothetical protein
MAGGSDRCLEDSQQAVNSVETTIARWHRQGGVIAIPHGDTGYRTAFQTYRDLPSKPVGLFSEAAWQIALEPEMNRLFRYRTGKIPSDP